MAFISVGICGQVPMAIPPAQGDSDIESGDKIGLLMIDSSREEIKMSLKRRVKGTTCLYGLDTMGNPICEKGQIHKNMLIQAKQKPSPLEGHSQTGDPNVGKMNPNKEGPYRIIDIADKEAYQSASLDGFAL
ncbi:hypothetical protein HAX54_000514 [Datura stramonium]|uniref:Uncharacterized protein n=1 Tax=Datura stramonium TaxID=4076 RepID=A0ABS8WS72_DATST|nr:hypothetical protein [Datura stramonium]